MRALLLLSFLVVFFSTTLKSQEFDSAFVHSNIITSSYDLEKKPLATVAFINKNGEIMEVQARCKCEKNVRENKIAIQLIKTFPSQSFTEKYLPDAVKMLNRFSSNYSWYEDSLKFQVSQITLYLTDNNVDSAVIKKISQEPQFNGKYRVSANIDYFNIAITKTNFSIASDIWGVAKLKMPIPFGWTEDDCLVNIYFSCYNSTIYKTITLPTFDDGH